VNNLKLKEDHTLSQRRWAKKNKFIMKSKVTGTKQCI